VTPVNKCSTNGKSCEVVSSVFDEAAGMNSISPEQPRCEVCPLNRVQAGVAVRIKQLCAAPEVQNRLREIGLGEDQIIRLVTSRTNFICQVCNARLAISEQLAQLILVEPVLGRIS
jgi:Fe2+ transport system protein FeoA